MVLEAQSESPVAQEAMEKLCRIYSQPIYSFVQRQGIAPEEAVDFGSVINCYYERKLLTPLLRPAMLKMSCAI